MCPQNIDDVDRYLLERLCNICWVAYIPTGSTARASRRRISPQYSGLISTPIARRPKFAAALRVVPLPAIGSITRSPGFVQLRMWSRASCGGNRAGWALSSRQGISLGALSCFSVRYCHTLLRFPAISQPPPSARDKLYRGVASSPYCASLFLGARPDIRLIA